MVQTVLIAELSPEDKTMRRATHTESITIHPTSGGVAPLYNPLMPSFRTVCSTQSRGPLKCASLVVCRRTLTVSNLRGSISRLFYMYIVTDEGE